MANLGTFNAHEIDPATPFDPIPAGKYLAMIVASEMQATKAGDGSYLKLTFEVIDGEFKNRKLWTQLNLQNPNSQAVQIAKSELSAICRAVGVMQPKDSVELHNLPLVITVKCRKREDTGDIQNEIKGYTKKESGSPAPTSPMVNNSSAPWKR